MTAVQTPWPGVLIDTYQPGGQDPLARHMFYANTMRDLRTLASYALGADLLKIIASRNAGVGTSASGLDRSVTIRMAKAGSSAGGGAAANAWSIANKFNTDRVFGGRTIKFAGKGSRTGIVMHNDAGSEAAYTRLATVRTPTWVALAHELIHAMHHLGGNAYSESVTARGGEVKREEMFTTGLGPYEGNRLSENAIRREANLPVRTFYTFPDDYKSIVTLAPILGGDAPPRGFWFCKCLQDSLEPTI